MPDKPDCACPDCTSILAREDVSESMEKLLTDFFTDVTAMRLTVQDAMLFAASFSAWAADNIYANAVKGDDDTPEAQDSFSASFVSMVEELLEQRIGVDPDEDEDEQPAAAEQASNAPEPVYVGTFGGDPDTRH